MKSSLFILLSALAILTLALPLLSLSSCASTSGLNSDGTYTATPALNTVDQTSNMLNQVRDWRN